MIASIQHHQERLARLDAGIRTERETFSRYVEQGRRRILRELKTADLLRRQIAEAERRGMTRFNDSLFLRNEYEK